MSEQSVATEAMTGRTNITGVVIETWHHGSLLWGLIAALWKITDVITPLLINRHANNKTVKL